MITYKHVGTPIFDQVSAEQRLGVFPTPRRTHKQFMEEHGYPAFLKRADAILSGEVPKPRPPRTPRKASS